MRLLTTVLLTLTLAAGSVQAKRGPDNKLQAFTTLKAGLKSADFQARSMAYQGIARNKRDKQLKTLLKDGTQDPQWVVRAGVARAYMYLRDNKWKRVIQDGLINRTLDPREVLPALDAQSNGSAVKEIISAIADKEHERQNAIIDGAVARNHSRLGLLVVGALNSKDDLVRSTGMRGLKQLKPVLHSAHLQLVAKKLGRRADVIGTLVDIANKALLTRPWSYLKALKPGKKAPKLQHAVVMARARYGDRSMAKAVLKIASTTQGSEQIKALEAYKKIAGKADGTKLKALLDGEPDKRLIFAVYEILAIIGDRSMSGQAQKLADGTNVDLRPTGVYYLGRIGGGAQIGRMHRYLADGLREVRLAAARVLAWIASPISVRPLRESLDVETDLEIRRELATALAAIKHRSALDALVLVQRDSDAVLRRRVVHALAESGERSVRQGLRIALNDNDKAVRVEAVRGFLMNDKANAVSVWKRSFSWLPRGTMISLTAEFRDSFESFVELALRCKRIRIREEALEALAMLPKKQAPLLRKVLARTNDPDLRIRVLNRLVKLLGKRASTEIKSMALSSGSARVRVAAIRHMGLLRRDKEARKMLTNMLNDTNQSVRIAAALTFVGG